MNRRGRHRLRSVARRLSSAAGGERSARGTGRGPADTRRWRLRARPTAGWRGRRAARGERRGASRAAARHRDRARRPARSRWRSRRCGWRSRRAARRGRRRPRRAARRGRRQQWRRGHGEEEAGEQRHQPAPGEALHVLERRRVGPQPVVEPVGQRGERPPEGESQVGRRPPGKAPSVRQVATSAGVATNGQRHRHLRRGLDPLQRLAVDVVVEDEADTQRGAPRGAGSTPPPGRAPSDYRAGFAGGASSRLVRPHASARIA